MRALIFDGSRPFLPTSLNIFIEGGNAYLNFNSIVGIDFLEFKKPISKEDFIEIAPLLTQSLF
jgi:hypothetical protein